MRIDWHLLEAEIELWHEANLTLPFWWRDDDAIEPSAKLDQLIEIATQADIPVHLAIIPKFATRALCVQSEQTQYIIPVTHGWSHQSHAKDGEKNAEFGSSRPIEDSVQDLIMGADRMSDLFGRNMKSMFVPPWNRINPDLFEHLKAIGYDVLSTYLPRKAKYATSKIEHINTHIDPICWKNTRSIVQIDILLNNIVSLLVDRRLGKTDNTEPLGLLTHHLVHDDAIWQFTKEFITIMRKAPIAAFR
ncbi:polysaccharide deacetylase [Amylibacter sp. SFDW26]|uniref:polysaccharide deacetylase family protein n=1 Tax=Amylibacter sp. SFDW26 TaxID=2652722 RepID=UPI0012628DEA|nr:polysaccharide deacetylase family protein [Amylibacter sp. SFDW26]KAB7616008.1 polysaccharide deacetylase [Amylibacter sp. SFDW26]